MKCLWACNGLHKLNWLGFTGKSIKHEKFIFENNSWLIYFLKTLREKTCLKSGTVSTQCSQSVTWFHQDQKIKFKLGRVHDHCKPIFIHGDFISRFTSNELVCDNLCSQPSFIQTRVVITIIQQRLVHCEKYLRWWGSR